MQGVIMEVDPPEAREDFNNIRAEKGLEPATFNYSDPGPNMHGDPMWEAIWDEIKTWDINVPTEYSGYSSGCGNHVTAIFKAIHNRFAEQETNGA